MPVRIPFRISLKCTNHLELPVKIVPVFSSVFESRDIVFNKENSVMGVSAQIHIPIICHGIKQAEW